MPSAFRRVVIALGCCALLALPCAARSDAEQPTGFAKPAPAPLLTVEGPPLSPESQWVMSCTRLKGGGVGCGPSQIPGYHPADPTWRHFAEAQRADGSWQGDVGTTGLVLWCFTNFGYCLPRPTRWPIGVHPFTDTMLRATHYLEQAQQLDAGDPDHGRFGARGDDVLAHSFAALALADLAALTHDDARTERAALALDHLVARQADDGTWPGDGAATADAWATYTLLACRARGIVDSPERAAARRNALDACARRLQAALDDPATASAFPLDVLAARAVLRWSRADERAELEARVTHQPDARWPSPDTALGQGPESRLWTWLAARYLRRAEHPAAHRLADDLVDAAMERPACLSPLTAPCEPGPFGGELDGAALAQVFLASYVRMDTSMGELGVRDA